MEVVDGGLGGRDSIGSRIRRARLEMGMTQAQLAGDDFSRPYISLLENDKIRPSLKSLQMLASRLARPVSYFLEGTLSTRSEGLLLIELAVSCLRMGDPHRADSLLRRSLRLAQELADMRLKGLALKKLAWVHNQRGDLDRSRRCCEEAVLLLKDYGTSAEVAEALVYLGHLYYRIDDFPRATRLYTRALEYLKDAHGADEVAFKAQLSLGSISWSAGDLGRALDHAQRALHLARHLDDHEMKARPLVLLSIVLRDRGRLDEALECAVEGLRSAVADRVETVSNLYNNLASIYALTGRRGEAKAMYRHSLAILDGTSAQHVESEAYRHLAMLELDDGNLEEASRHARRAIDCGSRSPKPSDLGCAQLVYARVLQESGNLSEARRRLLEAKRILEETGMVGAARLAGDLLSRSVADLAHDDRSAFEYMVGNRI